MRNRVNECLGWCDCARRRIAVLVIIWLGMNLASPQTWAVSYVYDAANRLTRVIHNNGMATDYSYDPAGNCTRKVVRRAAAAHDLKLGWNLISLPVEPASPAVTDLFHDYLETVYHGAILEWIGGYGGHFGNAAELHALQGYWVPASATTAVDIRGTAPATTFVNLHQGWNLVGPATANVTLPGYWCWRWDPATSQFKTVASDESLQIGLGYWIYATENGAVDLGQ